jgi:hypothetical protein
MEELLQKVRTAISVVGWFALGEAKTIAKLMKVAVLKYEKNRSPDNEEELKKIATRAAHYLSVRYTETSNKHAAEIRKALSSVKSKE